MSTATFEKACLRGVEGAFKKHMKFSGGLPLNFAPEAFIQGQIALELAKLGVYVSLESHVYNTLRDAGAELRGRQTKRVGGRIDLVTWWKNGKPRLLIEVKKLRHKEAISADAKRLRQVLGRGGSVRHGLVVAYVSAKNASTIDGRIQHAAQAPKCKLACRTGPIPYRATWLDDSTWFYEAACFRVEG